MPDAATKAHDAASVTALLYAFVTCLRMTYCMSDSCEETWSSVPHSSELLTCVAPGTPLNVIRPLSCVPQTDADGSLVVC